MRLLNIETEQMEETFEQWHYAILSHTWDGKEPTYQDFCSHPDAVLQTPKIRGLLAQAKHYKVRYVWVDTICIDKSSSAELQEAINSMFRWYRDAVVCITYLSDVDCEAEQHRHPRAHDAYDAIRQAFTRSRWFTRGWTLQELIAPFDVDFYDRSWRFVGTKYRQRIVQDAYLPRSSLIGLIEDATRIPVAVLSRRSEYQDNSVAQRMSWAASRQTTRKEDRAYSLMGLFDVQMPMLYGEGDAAFTRLQEEIMKKTDDHTLLAYNFDYQHTGWQKRDVLSPANYGGCLTIKRYDGWAANKDHYSMTNMGLHVNLDVIEVAAVPGMLAARLNCTNADAGVGVARYARYAVVIPVDQPREGSGGTMNQFFRPDSVSPVSIPSHLFQTLPSQYKTFYMTRNLPYEVAADHTDFQLQYKDTFRHMRMVERYPPLPRPQAESRVVHMRFVDKSVDLDCIVQVRVERFKPSPEPDPAAQAAPGDADPLTQPTEPAQPAQPAMPRRQLLDMSQWDVRVTTQRMPQDSVSLLELLLKHGAALPSPDTTAGSPPREENDGPYTLPVDGARGVCIDVSPGRRRIPVVLRFRATEE